MLKEAINRILDLAVPNVEEIDGHIYSDKTLKRIDPPQVETVHLRSLDSLIQLLNDESEKPPRLGTIVHVVSPTTVHVISNQVAGFYRERYYTCQAMLPDIMFDRFIDVENFNIMLQSTFIDNEERSKVLSVVGNIRSAQVQSIDDDGISQQVEVKAGIQRAATAVVPNPVMLAPYRTFLEVEQPTSAFVLRLKDGPSAALFEADGGAWQIEAVKRIQAYLQDRLPEDVLVIA